MAPNTEAAKFTKDSGYAWIILLCSSLTRMIDTVLFVTFGIFILEFMEYFHLDQAFSITSVVSCYFLTFAITGLVGGFAIKKCGVRPVMIVGTSINVLMLLASGTFPYIWLIAISFATMGAGSQLVVQGTVVMTQTYFDKRRSLASGVLMGGISLGTFIWPPFIRYLIDTYTWRGAYYIVAGITLQIFVFISLLRPPPSNVAPIDDQRNKQKEELNDASSSNGCQKLLKFEYFIWILYIICFMAQCAPHFVPMSYYPMKGKEDGIEKSLIPIPVSVYGGLGLVTRPLAGIITDRFNNRIGVAIAALFICGTILIVTALVHTFVLLLMLAISIGIFQSFYMGTAYAQWVDVFGLENIALGSGLGGFAIGISSVILHPIAGKLVDLTGNTNTLFFIFGGVQIISGILLLVVKFLLKYKQNLKQEERDSDFALS